MTREENKAIEFLKDFDLETYPYSKVYYSRDYIKEFNKNLNMIIKALEQEPNIDELRVEITALQNRCYALTKGVMCGFCNYECQYKVDRNVE